MMNPYQLSQSQTEALDKPSSGLASALQLSAGFVCAVITALVPTLAVPKFSEIFISFNAEVPLITNIALGYHLWLWALPFIVVAAHLFWPKPERRPLASCLVGVMSLIVVTPVIIYAMYAPIFLLGNPV